MTRTDTPSISQSWLYDMFRVCWEMVGKNLEVEKELCRIGPAKKFTAFNAISLCSVRIYGYSPAEGLTRKVSLIGLEDRKNVEDFSDWKPILLLNDIPRYSLTIQGLSGSNPYGMQKHPVQNQTQNGRLSAEASRFPACPS